MHYATADVCQCPNTIRSSTISTGVNNTESIEILSVCSGKPCDDSCSNYFDCKVRIYMDDPIVKSLIHNNI